MSSQWLPLPFPKCTRCNQSWVITYHRDCDSGAEVLVEPYRRQAKCDGCGEQWNLMSSAFSCSCGYEFHASDVEEALSTSSILRQRLLQKIYEMDQSEIAIVQASQSSFNRWMENVSFEIGRFLGTTGASLKRLITNLLDRL